MLTIYNSILCGSLRSLREIKILFWVAILASSSLFAQPEAPRLTKYATDLTGTLNSTQLNELSTQLRSFDNKTSNQVVFLMINTLDDYPIEMYTNEVSEKNKIGTKESDNGVLFLVVKNDRKMRIEVGYGLEGSLPDALASSILRNEVGPNFKKGDFYSGITAGLNAIQLATVGEYKNDKRQQREDQQKKGFPWGYIIFLIMIFIFGRGRGGGMGSLLLLGALGSSGRGSSGGSGFGGGFGGGGFSGGGGGFGGGGASGSW